MKYDFDKVVDRKNTNSLKYDFAVERGKPADIMPLWVADMDFRVPDEVITALKERAEHGIFGYSEPKTDYFKALCNWSEKRHGWKPDPEKYVLTCGVVFAICSLLRVLTDKGDGVIICQPVYYPFENSIKNNERKLIVSELVNNDGHYTVDFEDFERKIVENKVKVFILCNPHNPVGRVWKREELERLGDICLKHNVFVIADEIHCDFTFGKNKHVPFPSVKKEFENNCAVCTSPSKSFNLAGMQISNIYVENDAVRGKFITELDRQGCSQPNVMGLVACQAAYEHGEKWFEQLKEYLWANIEFVREYVAVNLPKVKFLAPEGTYLVWLDLREYGYTDEQLEELMQNKAKLWLDDGYIFGKGGSGFQRINVGCPRSVLAEALDKLKSVL